MSVVVKVVAVRGQVTDNIIWPPSNALRAAALAALLLPWLPVARNLRAAARRRRSGAAPELEAR
ncbi:MAG: hypothetical protein ABJC62_02135 [Frankiaceae bacterium]